jgi:predicted nucleic acid-binding protein
MAWMAEKEADEAALFLSAFTLAELYRGVLRMEDGHPRRARLLGWSTSDLPARVGDRILSFDAGVARTWGEITTQVARNVPVPTMDSLIAAIAVHHGLVLVTRNSADFRHFPSLALETPWQGRPAG